MPFFVSARELKRIAREASDARKRASEAEMRLHEISLAVLDARATKEGGYPISTRLPQKAVEEVKETEFQYHERLRRENAPLWEYYLGVATQNGKGEDDAMEWLVCAAEGKPLPFEREGIM